MRFREFQDVLRGISRSFWRFHEISGAFHQEFSGDLKGFIGFQGIPWVFQGLSRSFRGLDGRDSSTVSGTMQRRLWVLHKVYRCVLGLFKGFRWF